MAIKERGLEAGEQLDVFRIVKSDNREDELFVDSFRSRSELGFEPRRREITEPKLHSGISVYETEVAAVSTARMFPKIGGFVAQLRLTVSCDFCFARTFHKGHITLWGDAEMLSKKVVKIVSIDIFSIGD